MALRPATEADWSAMTGLPAPLEWFGFTEQTRPWLIDGIGAVYLGSDGRWWITFQRALGVKKTKTAHAAARKLLGEAKARGLSVNGLADPAITGADTWMARLGFRHTDERIGGIDVWTL